MTGNIRPLQSGDEEKWRALFAAYQDFYRARIPDDIVAHTWGRIFDANSPVNGIGAELDGELVGFTHYLFHAARNLILAVEAAAREKTAFRVYWQTEQYNSRARSLYDTITPPSSFIVYRMSLTA